MPYLKKLSIATALIAAVASPAAFAQDESPVMEEAPQVVDIFTAADVDADGALDRDEFVSYIVMKADSGDADYRAIKISGEYDNHFNTKDYNADGLLTAEELTAPVNETEDAPDAMPEEGSEIEPG